MSKTEEAFKAVQEFQVQQLLACAELNELQQNQAAEHKAAYHKIMAAFPAGTSGDAAYQIVQRAANELKMPIMNLASQAELIEHKLAQLQAADEAPSQVPTLP